MIWIGTTAPVTFNGVSAFVVLRPDRLNPDEYAPRRTHCSTVCCMTHGLLLQIHATEEPGEGQISCTPVFFSSFCARKVSSISFIHSKW
jgi:hypothetical protein